MFANSIFKEDCLAPSLISFKMKNDIKNSFLLKATQLYQGINVNKEDGDHYRQQRRW